MILNETLRNFDYYVSKLPMYLRNSHGFIEHYRIWFDFLVGRDQFTGIANCGDAILNGMYIFEPTYLSYLAQMEEYDNYTSDILDKLGNLFGVTRKFSVSYTYNGSTVNKVLNLSNKNFLVLIKSQIIKNYCDGTREQIEDYYRSTENEILCTNESPAVCEMYISEDADEETKDMFLAGLLTIKSVGIQYIYSLADFGSFLIWDNSNWDEVNWAI